MHNLQHVEYMDKLFGILPSLVYQLKETSFLNELKFNFKVFYFSEHFKLEKYSVLF